MRYDIARSSHSRSGKRPTCRPSLQQLEAREVPAVTAWLSGGVLSVQGTEEDDVIALRQTATQIVVTDYGQHIGTFPAGVTRVEVGSDHGDDEVDATGLFVTVHIDGGAGDDTLSAGAGDDRILGGDGDNLLNGGGGADDLQVGLGQSRLYGGAGNDTLSGGHRRDVIYGGNGDDLISGGDNFISFPAGSLDGNDLIDGDAGNDTIYAGAGHDIVYGGTGNDVLWGDWQDPAAGGFGNDQLYGEAGNDILEGARGENTLKGGSGNDTISGDHANDTIDGGVGDDLLSGSLGNDRITGSTGRDTIYAGYDDDTIDGGAGDDLLYGGSGGDIYVFDTDKQLGTDTVVEYASEGGDTLNFGPSATGVAVRLGRGDRQVVNSNLALVITSPGEVEGLVGGSGADTLYGYDGRDTIRGGPGPDIIEGVGGESVLYGGSGNDTISGGHGDDMIDGEAGDDLLSGSVGNDLIFGGNGNDTVYAGYGDDTVNGSPGDDLLVGGEGNDALYGHQGADLLNGGPGVNTYDDGNSTGKRVLYINFDGATLTRAQIARVASWADKDGDGAALQEFLSGQANREDIIQETMRLIHADFARFGVDVVRHVGGIVEGTGATTLYVGPADLDGAEVGPAGIATYDRGNVNKADVGFVLTGARTTSQETAQYAANVAAKQAGYTYGLQHVNRFSNLPPGTTPGLGWNEFMDPIANLNDFAFLDRDLDLVDGSGLQNSHRLLWTNLGLRGVAPSGPSGNLV